VLYSGGNAPAMKIVASLFLSRVATLVDKRLYDPGERAAATLETGIGVARDQSADVAPVKIDMGRVGEPLQEEVFKLFQQSFDQLLAFCNT
jgi:hypothetical protein